MSFAWVLPAIHMSRYVKYLKEMAGLAGTYTVKRLLKQVARGWIGSGAQRRSEMDPKLKHFHAVSQTLQLPLSCPLAAPLAHTDTSALLQARQRAHDLHALGVRAPREGHVPLAGIAVEPATPASKHKRGMTVPSIQEILDAIAQVGPNYRQKLNSAFVNLSQWLTLRWLAAGAVAREVAGQRLAPAQVAQPSVQGAGHRLHQPQHEEGPPAHQRRQQPRLAGGVTRAVRGESPAPRKGSAAVARQPQLARQVRLLACRQQA